MLASGFAKRGETPLQPTINNPVGHRFTGSLCGQILQTITSLLSSDKDVVNFSLVCKEIWERVLATDSTIWRHRFSAKYDIPPGRTSSELMWEYQIRAIVLPQKVDFKQGDGEWQQLWLDVIQTLIQEVLTLPVEVENSKTYNTIQQVMTRSNFLSHPKREQPSELFCAVQLVGLSFTRASLI